MEDGEARFNVVMVACGRVGDSLRDMPDDSVVRVALVLMALADGDAAQVFAVSLSRIHPKRNGDRMNHVRRPVTTDLTSFLARPNTLPTQLPYPANKKWKTHRHCRAVRFLMNSVLLKAILVGRAGRGVLGRSLHSRLHGLVLLDMLLLQLLGLLLMTRFDLLFLRFIVLFGYLLVFFFLLLLKFLAFLLLLSVLLFLLLLEFLILLRVTRICRSRSFRRGKLAHMSGGIGLSSVIGGASIRGSGRRALPRLIFAMVGRRSIAPTGFAGPYCVGFEISGPGGGSDFGSSLVHGSALLLVGMGFLKMLVLSRDGSNMSLLRGSFLFRSRPRSDSAVAAVIADVVDGRAIHGRVVDVVNVLDVYIQNRPIIEEMTVIPAAALEASSEITETIVDASIKSNGRPPIPVIEHEAVSTPAPISGRPEKANFGSHNPCAGHPVIVVEIIAPCPVPGCPEISIAGTNGLLIDRQWRRSEADNDADGARRRCR